MQSRAGIASAAVTAALVVGVAAVTHPATAQQGDTTQQERHQGNPEPQGREQKDQSGAAPGAQAPAPAPAGNPAASAAQIVTSSATLLKIDHTADKLTLKDAMGKTFDVKPGPRVNLSRLHVGDKVTASYFEEVAVAINEASLGAPRMTQRTVSRGGVTAQQATVTAQIVSVDPKSDTVVIRAPDGNTHRLKVQDVDLQAQLTRIKPEDVFDVTYIQAVAISVEPRK
jgi:hypothetical protein